MKVSVSGEATTAAVEVLPETVARDIAGENPTSAEESGDKGRTPASAAAVIMSPSLDRTPTQVLVKDTSSDDVKQGTTFCKALVACRTS